MQVHPAVQQQGDFSVFAVAGDFAHPVVDGEDRRYDPDLSGFFSEAGNGAEGKEKNKCQKKCSKLFHDIKNLRLK